MRDFFIDMPSWDHRFIAHEVKKQFHLPEYNDDPAFYEDLCKSQGTSFVVGKRWRQPEVNKLQYLTKKLRQIGISDTIQHGQLFVCRPNFVGGWHLDGINRHLSLNFPLFNTEEYGEVEWTNTEIAAVKEINMYTAHSKPLHTIDAITAWPVAAAARLTCAQLLKVDKWHRLNNKGNPVHRIIFSIRLNSNPLYEDLLPLFERYA